MENEKKRVRGQVAKYLLIEKKDGSEKIAVCANSQILAQIAKKLEGVEDVKSSRALKTKDEAYSALLQNYQKKGLFALDEKPFKIVDVEGEFKLDEDDLLAQI